MIANVFDVLPLLVSLICGNSKLQIELFAKKYCEVAGD